MTVNILSLTALITSLITIAAAIWKLAEARASLQKTIDRADARLAKKIDGIQALLKEEIHDIESQYELNTQVKLAEEKAYKELLEAKLIRMYERHKNVKKDLYDVQRFLQKEHNYKIRLNTSTLNDRDEDEI